MAIKISCACGKSLALKDELAGKKVRCPACQETLSVPKAKAESDDDERDLEDAADDGFVDEAPVNSKSSRGGNKSASRAPGSKKVKSKGKSSSGDNRGLVIGLSAGGGLLVIALLAWMFWPAKPATDVAAAPLTNNTGNSVASTGDATNTTNAVRTEPGAPPNGNAGNPVENTFTNNTPTASKSNPSVPATASTTMPEGDLGLLQGTWQPTDVAVDADQPPPANMLAAMKLITWTFRDDMVSLSTPNGAMTSTVKLDPSQSPKTLDMTRIDGQEAGKVGLAIYSLDGDTLKLCMTNSGTVRPKEMKPDKALGQMVLTLKKGSPPANGNAVAAVPGMEFDLKAWQQASDKFKAMKVFSILSAREPNDPSFPDGVTHYAVIDPMVNDDGKIPLGLWAAMSKVSYLAVRTQSISDVTILQQLSHHRGLVGLNISGRSTVTAAGIAELKKCPHLRSLHLSGVPVSPELLNAITQLGELRALGIHDATASGEMVSVIPRLGKLESLSLQNCGVTDDDMVQIGKLTKLSSLLLSKSKLTDKGLQSVSGLKLRSLFLDESQVTDQGLSSLKSQAEMTMLSVRGLGLSPQALADFQAAVPKCRVLK